MTDNLLAPTRMFDVVGAGVRWSRLVVVEILVLTLAARALPATAHDLVVLVLVAAGRLAGLPHGAVDHRLAARLTGRPMALFGRVYASLAALAWVLLVEVGAVVLVPVLALSLLHFGVGRARGRARDHDLAALARRGGRLRAGPDGRPGPAAGALGRPAGRGRLLDLTGPREPAGRADVPG